MYKEYYESPIGTLVIIATDEAVTEITFEDEYYEKEMTNEGEVCEPIKLAVSFLDDYFAGNNPDPFDVPIDPAGSDFQKEVWDLVREIPYGETASYGDIADIIGMRRMHKMAAQAVGGAMKKNPILLVVPCHRVIAVGGKLGGYAGHPERKRYLLTHEGVYL